MSIEKFNHGSKFNFEGLKDNVFIGLGELVKNNGINTKYKLAGFYINNKGKYGPAPVAVIQGFNVNLPKHLLEDIELMLTDEEVVTQINDGRAGFMVDTYTTKDNKEYYTVTWCNL